MARPPRKRTFDELAGILGERRRTRSTGRRTPPPGIPDPGTPEYKRLLDEALALPHTQRTPEMRAVVKWERERAAALAKRFDFTDNERLRFELVRHNVYVLRFAAGSEAATLRLLSASEALLKDLIERGTGPMAGRAYSRELERKLQRLMQDVRELRRSMIFGAFSELGEELRNFAVLEGRYMANAANATSSVQLGATAVPASTYRALVSTTPFEGRTLVQWQKKLLDDDVARIEAAVRRGLIEGHTPQQMTRTVLGSAAARGSDGLTQITRNQAGTIARTAVATIANAARGETAEANADILKKEQYVATLDSRTTIICATLDGSVYDVGEGPFPPQHFRCRSVRVPIIDKEAAGDRPMKPITEREVLRRYGAATGVTATTRDNLPRGHKGRFDEFARREVRRITGTIPARTTYQEFFSRQPAWFQDDVLGQTRGALFRRGGLSLDKFVDRKTGAAYTLAELARRQREAFVRAGFDPEEFL